VTIPETLVFHDRAVRDAAAAVDAARAAGDQAAEASAVAALEAAARAREDFHRQLANPEPMRRGFWNRH
jgi:hypothetical protein